MCIRDRSLTVEYTAPQGVTSVACPSHPARVEIEGNQARVELMGSAIQLDRDFVLNVALARPFDACAVLTRDGDGAHAWMVNLYPCLLYKSDAADERSRVNIGGRRIIKKKKE